MEGFSTDPSRTVDIYAIDIDCGTGAATARTPWVSNFFVDPGPPTGAVMGRWRWRPAGGDFLPPSRSVGVRVSGGIPAVVNPVLNIMTGQYQAPNFTFIFPENLGIGTPPVPSNFGDLAFLRNGSGPWNGASNQFIGQLNPWPDATAPEVSCTAGGTPPPPPATAVAAFSPSPGPVATGTTVTLDATGKHAHQRSFRVDANGRTGCDPHESYEPAGDICGAQPLSPDQSYLPGKRGRRELNHSSNSVGDRSGCRCASY